MKKTILMALILVSCAAFSQKKEIISIWPGKVPGELKDKGKPVIDTTKKDDVLRLAEVTDPTIEVWLPDRNSSTTGGIIVCPGGGYNKLAYDKEGTEIAGWLNKNGIAAFVLAYRVPNKREGALQDAQRALRIIKSRAQSWNLNPDKIGIMGFSAGGSLSARSATAFSLKTYKPVDAADSLSCRPAFALLIYPAYLDQGQGRTLTPELKITQQTPPMFIFQSADDTFGNSSLVMAGAMRDAKIPVELHLVPKGGHGYGLRSGNAAAEAWPALAEKWFKDSAGIIKK